MMADLSLTFDPNKISAASDSASDAISKCAANSDAASDAISKISAKKLDDLAAPDDNTDLNVTTLLHGLCPKAPADGMSFLNGLAGAWVEHKLGARRWCKLVANNATSVLAGIAATSSGTLANDDDDDSSFTRWKTGAVSGNSAGVYSTTTNFIKPHHNPTFYCKFKTYSDITNMRFFIGLNANNSDWLADPTSGNLVMLRYVSGTANFNYITKDGVTLNAQNSGLAVAASTVYTFKIVVSADGASVLFTLNGAYPITITTNLPEDSTALGFSAWLLTQEAVAKYLSISQIYVEGD